ncbi:MULTISPECIES: tyrosine-type recombinase/integrase [unclassified Mesorhizobium]|uniref:tyrosine-type recombinase/integrase n=1 Tax=unclassified Mesorhizobium TaxID=325217 RepID=UPI000FD5749E|nr:MULTISPECIES: tyrosine-type recombinase/integrase [unclassified Mesorhizobium]RUV94628.1 hypothetical protein EOA88_05360 [Mesorhizobium sp. M5C.F.Ca.IN.020.14.1.1]RUV13326.1 hypothetical protein EOA86_33325 [Mesorhizobium sp. M5C.F.Ca.IN.020.32.2.1]RWG39529.1 MAG: hypothetical protein EOQ62_31270 [Mesorhizobium sp.]RWH44546.1 MAG: hypothetical protein EOQ80_20875 [Mesorhizobium sp.]RWH54803.1 MAG: hypothetical protein EOQ82_17880 [Mesorhizobium sp.]
MHGAISGCRRHRPASATCRWRRWQSTPLLVGAGLFKLHATSLDADGNPLKITKYNFHALRHTAASLFIEQKLSPKRVQTIMGHSSITVTFDTYGHLFEDDAADQTAVAEIEARLLS